ncbi:hypothetical protein BT69DRAFT_1352481 [Atractiella rhizophila]|nr:hypothetical protein BT69DRAFT_1352481 [Atractiella rhizophila]
MFLIMFLLFALVSSVIAQQSDAICGQGFDWLQNDLKQSPCVVASSIFGSCTNTQFNLWALPGPNWLYPGPTSRDPGDYAWNRCDCTMELYNLLSACAYCQGAHWPTFASHTQLCNASFTGDDRGALYELPVKVPADTELPSWVTHNSSANAGGTFDVDVARQIADHPSSSSSSSTPVGAIVGGVIGGLALLALIGGIFYFLQRRKQQKSQLASADSIQSPFSPFPYASTPSNTSQGCYGHTEMLETRSLGLSSISMGESAGGKHVPELQTEDLARPDTYLPFHAPSHTN